MVCKNAQSDGDTRSMGRGQGMGHSHDFLSLYNSNLQCDVCRMSVVRNVRNKSGWKDELPNASAITVDVDVRER